MVIQLLREGHVIINKQIGDGPSLYYLDGVLLNREIDRDLLDGLAEADKQGLIVSRDTHHPHTWNIDLVERAASD